MPTQWVDRFTIRRSVCNHPEHNTAPAADPREAAIMQPVQDPPVPEHVKKLQRIDTYNEI